MMLKKKLSKKILLFILMFIAVLVFVSIPKITPEAADTTVSELQKQINEKKASAAASANKKKQLENQIAALKNQQVIAINDKKIYDDLISTIENEIEIRKGIIDDNEKLKVQVGEQIKTAESDYETSYNLFLDMIEFSYEEGDVNYLSLLMGSEDFTDFLSRIDILSGVLEYNKTVIEKVKDDKIFYENMKVSYDEIVAQQDEYIKELSDKSAEAEQWRKEAISKANKADKDIKANQAAQAQLEADDKAMQNEIARLQKEQQALRESQKKYVGGTFLWPVDPVASTGRKTYVSSGFGYRTSPITGRSEFHTGIDIPAPYGSNIYAANDGTIIIMTYAAGYGNYIVIDHGGNKATMYYHASAFNRNLKVGSTVKKGDVIAYVGSTGWSTGNHVHLCYLENGEYKNPLQNGFVIPK